MRNSSDNNGDHRPTLPSIWDLFRDELSEPSSRFNFQPLSSSDRGQHRRYHPNRPGNEDHPSIILDPGHGHSSSSAEDPFTHHFSDAPGPTFYQPSIPPSLYSPQEIHHTPGDANWHHHLGVSPHGISTPTASANFPPSIDSLGRQGPFSQTPSIPTSSHSQVVNDERNPGANYSTFRCFQPSFEESNSNAKYECQYCGKAFTRPSTLRIHLNSHTGEKPFVCPVEGCGRSFGVLSNMRRHARVHTQPTTREGTVRRGDAFWRSPSNSMMSQQASNKSSEDNNNDKSGSDHHE